MQAPATRSSSEMTPHSSSSSPEHEGSARTTTAWIRWRVISAATSGSGTPGRQVTSGALMTSPTCAVRWDAPDDVDGSWLMISSSGRADPVAGRTSRDRRTR